MDKFCTYLKCLAAVSLLTVVMTSCATVDYFNGKPDGFGDNETLPEETGTVSFPEEEDNTETPTSPPPVEEIKPTPPPEEKLPSYIVQKGDTLFSISHRYGHSITKLAEWNNLSPPYYLKVGQKLMVNPPTTTVESPTKEKSLDTYEVVKGDTLSTIAKRYQCTVEELAIWNDLKPPYPLKIGQTLRVSPRTQ